MSTKLSQSQHRVLKWIAKGKAATPQECRCKPRMFEVLDRRGLIAIATTLDDVTFQPITRAQITEAGLAASQEARPKPNPLRTALLKLRGHPILGPIANIMIGQLDDHEQDEPLRAAIAKNARRLQIAHAGQPVTIKSPAEIAAAFGLGQARGFQ